MYKHYRKLLQILLFIICLNGTSAFAQTSSNDSTIYEDEEIVEPVEDIAASTYKKGKFNLVDTASSVTINKGNVHLEDTIHQLKNEEAFWYADGLTEEKKSTKEPSNFKWTWLDNFIKFLLSNTFKIISWTIIGLIILFLLFIFLKNNGINLLASKPKKIASSDAEITTNIFEIDFAKELQKSIDATNYTLATRLLFLQLLKRLTELEFLEYAPDKTNFDYLFALNGKAFYTDFALAVKNYEYVCYGNFELNEQKFVAIKNNFYLLQQKLAS